MSDKFTWKDSDIIVRTDNKGLTCENCKLRFEKPAWCGVYDIKPKEIFDGGECEKKIPE